MKTIWWEKTMGHILFEVVITLSGLALLSAFGVIVWIAIRNSL